MEQSNKNEDKRTPQVKIIFIIIDGIGELGISSKNNQTPLQYLKLPHFNAIAKSGLNGLMDPVETGLACGSDTAHMNIFGYNPFKLYRGRGSFESLGSGIPMDLTEIAFKCNFSYLNEQTGVVEKRRVDRDFPSWGLPLIDVLNGMRIPGYKDHYITVVHATEHRCGVKVSGPNLTDEITGTDPLKDNLPLKKVQPKNKGNPNAVFTAELMNVLSKGINEKLRVHPLNVERVSQGKLPGNIVLLRGAGQRLNVDTFEKVHGLKSFVIAPTAIIRGLGETIGMEVVNVKGTTGDKHSDWDGKGTSAVHELTQNDKKGFNFGFVHLKAIDDAGHDKSLEDKEELFHKADKMLKTILESIAKQKHAEDEFIIALTGDHTTPVITGDHTFEPVPFMISSFSSIVSELGWISTERSDKLQDLRDGVSHYDEISAAKGVLGRFPGSEMMGVIKKFKKTIESIIIS